ncbi:MAG TPA: HAD-IIIA family hydrolase [Methylomirabilota bacterium]|nr:HAD-IIIA family hydrolase [Methylomirabilota bacterium]
MKQLVILAGGKGTRLKDRLGDLPKPMIPIAGKPLLQHQIELAGAHGFGEVLLFVHHRADLIQEHFGQGSRFALPIRYITEKEPLGTAGAVLAGFDQLADRFVVMYGDTMMNVDLTRLWSAHEQSGADATLFLHPNNHPLDSDLVETNAEGWVTTFHNRPHAAGQFFRNLVNAGLYVIEKCALEPWSHDRKLMDFGKDLFPALLNRNAKLFGYNSPEFIKDIGTPDRYDWVCAQYEAGIVQRSSLATPQRVVFLDRDGTLVKEVSAQGLHRIEDLELLPGVSAAVHELNQTGLRAVMITNQPVVAKGFCTEEELQQIHNKLETLLGREHAFLDRIYYCPHHPEKGFPGERPELKIECKCRKPEPGMVLEAQRDLNIDLANSWFIGDTTTDVQTARNAGVKSILVRTGHGGADRKHDVAPDFVFESLPEAVQFIAARSTETSGE